jgi:hypothetical protein
VFCTRSGSHNRRADGSAVTKGRTAGVICTICLFKIDFAFCQPSKELMQVLMALRSEMGVRVPRGAVHG